MKIWAHRGCSQQYPENTFTSFSKALEISGLTGIELDIQMTRDGEIVVIHDERVDRTTDGIGYVKDYTYSDLRKLAIKTNTGHYEQIPSIQEVLDLMQDRMKRGIQLNIELKNSEIIYDGMEKKILELVVRKNVQNYVVYFSFNAKSLQKIREMDPDVSIGILDMRVSDCLNKKNEHIGKNDKKIALHPYWKGIDLSKNMLEGQIVRAWFLGHLYPEKPTGNRLGIKLLENIGITDVFLNEPEVYLS